MNKKIVVAIVTIIIICLSFFTSVRDNNKYTKTVSTKISSKNIPVKVEDIEIDIKKVKNGKNEVLLYLKAKNKSKIDISYLGVDVSDGNKLNTRVEYLQPIKSGSKTDNYDSIKNSKDDRTKIPVKGSDGNPLHDLNDIKIKKIVYVFKHKGYSKMAEFAVDSAEYTLSDY